MADKFNIWKKSFLETLDIADPSGFNMGKKITRYDGRRIQKDT